MKFFVLGATGMAGHAISLYLQEQGHQVVTFTRTPFLLTKNIIGDVCDSKQMKDFINKNQFDAVVNCTGILNQNAEANKQEAVLINSYIPHHLAYITQDTNTKIIHLSTDCVFSGQDGNYHEKSLRDGVTFYDRSKALGELDNKKDLTFRNSIIGPDMRENGIGLVNWFMKQSGVINGYTRAIWTGVTSLVLARAIEKATRDSLVGLYNLVNNSKISKYELLGLFNQYLKKNQLKINKCDSVLVDKSLINNRTDFNFIVPSYEDMVVEMKEWIINHKELYRHYILQ
ncbi:MAG: NAD(P)-dependent oxidoreductase [Firmicutes bacterium]|nr:NAD(P)-dependent oxidoreductase [Bacillota bacterium]